jgi:hypothetical protein
VTRTAAWKARRALERPFQCSRCDGRYKSQLDLDQHVQAVHERKRAIRPPLCPYCGETSVLLRSSGELYRGRDYGPAWLCRPCQAWVGCHPGGIVPLGRLADAELRKAKMAAHGAFDPLWKRVKERGGDEARGARVRAYAWLAEQMGLTREACHIGMFDVDQCRMVVEICTKPYGRK